MLSTSEAARTLGISTRRVRALIESGQLQATRVGRSWVIDEASAEARRSLAPKPGRPSRDADDQVRSYTLMCRNDAVLDFRYHHKMKQVLKVSEVRAPELAPVGACAGAGRINPLSLSSWIANRYIPSNRIGITDLLRKAGVSDTAELLFRSLGLNLTDQYWFRPQEVNLDWHAINYFENPYTGDREGNGPGSGTPGALEKWWEQRDGVSYLIKAGSPGDREPFAELLTTQLYERILEPADFVRYDLEFVDHTPYSVCANFVAPNMQLVTLRDLFACYAKNASDPYDLRMYLDICERIGMPDIEEHVAKTIVCDFLNANTDRHDMNLGVLRNVDTLEFVGPAPIFDNGRCFYFDARHPSDFDGGIRFYTSHPFSEYPTAQLALVNDYSWFDEERLDGFDEDIREILSRNEQLPEWFPDAAARQFNIQLQRVREAKRERSQ